MRLKLDHGSDGGGGEETQVSALCVQHVPAPPFLGASEGTEMAPESCHLRNLW